MPTPFIMPKFDMDQTSATIVEWLKSEGDFVNSDEEVLVVETDKVGMEVTAPASGILAGIRAGQGDQVPVTEVIAYILAEGETEADIPRVTPATKPVEAKGVHSPTPPATPIAVRMAGELGINLGDIDTEGGRITKADVERFVDGLRLPASLSGIRATPAARRAARELGLDLSQISGSGPRGRVQEEDVRVKARTQWDHSTNSERPSVIQPLSTMRRTIAERMQTSSQTVPHITLSIDVDITHFEEARARLNKEIQADEAAISVTAFLVYLAAQVLKRYPGVNASYIDHQIYLWDEINIGVATTIEDGLVVPVVHQADEMLPGEINGRLRELVERAQTGKLTLAEVKGGSFTISNLGMYGIHQFQAIINPPESAILAVGAIVRKPVVINEFDEFGVRPVMNLSLSADHRILDGVSAARFLSDLAQSILNPGAILD